MRGFGIACLVAMGLVGVLVGVRLLRLARRTGGAPERAVGFGLLLVAVLGGPAAGAARAPGMVGTLPGDLLFAGGLGCVQLGIALFFVFNLLVFRSGSRAVRVAVAGAALGLGVEWLGLVTASWGGASMSAVLPHTRPWGIAIVVSVGLAFSWTAVESLRYAGLLERRIGYGLGDPVTANRFWLWGAAGVATSVLCAAIVASMALGLAPLRHPLPLTLIALAALVVSACWSLAFAPPDAYLRAVRARYRSA